MNEKIYEPLINIAVLLVVTALYALTKRIKALIVQKFKETSVPNSRNIEVGQKTYDILTDIMVKYDCNRVMLLEFHNGDTFSSVMPNWKLSMTYEVTDSHTPKTINYIQNVRASLVIDIVSGCFDKKYPDGIDNHMTCHECCGDMIYFDVDEMANGYAKGIFQSNGSKYLFGVPIREGKKAIGIVLIDYTEPVLLDLINRQGCKLCETVNEISALWITYQKDAYTPKLNKFIELIKRIG